MTNRIGDRADISTQGIEGIFEVDENQLRLLLFCQSCKMQYDALPVAKKPAFTFPNGRFASIAANNPNAAFIAATHNVAFHKGK